jgi:hypothetical protein
MIGNQILVLRVLISDTLRVRVVSEVSHCIRLYYILTCGSLPMYAEAFQVSRSQKLSSW